MECWLIYDQKLYSMIKYLSNRRREVWNFKKIIQEGISLLRKIAYANKIEKKRKNRKLFNEVQPFEIERAFNLLAFWKKIFKNIPLIFFSSTLSMTGSIYSSTSLNRTGNPYLMDSSNCFKKSGSLNVKTLKMRKKQKRDCEMNMNFHRAFVRKKIIPNYPCWE